MEQIKALIEEQRLNEADLTAFQISFAESSPENLSKMGYLRSRLEQCEAYMAPYKSNHLKIFNSLKGVKKTKNDFSYFNDSEYEQFEQKFMDIKGDILDKILLLEASASKEPSSSSVNQTFFEHSFRDENDIHLPKVKLPEFDGNYENWSVFHDLYTSMIHIKTNISNAQKLYFLKKCLNGDAEALIRSIKCTNVNYATAWKTLCDRYDNKRFLVDSYLKILCEQPDMQKESSSSIRKLLYTTKECLDSISNLGVSTDSWDLFVIFLISQKLDKSSRRNWENFLVHKNSSLKNKTNELPKLEDFSTFLEDSFRSLEAVETKISIHSKEKAAIPNKTQVCSRSLHTSKRNFKTPSCICCHETHYLYLCPQFKAFSSDKKIEFAKNNNLCLNCLVQGHTVSQCKIKYNCRICNKRHHTLMHIENNNSSNVQSTSNNGTSKTQSLVCTDSTVMTVPQILLATAKVQISTPSGDHFLRALVDQGSQSSFITERCVQRLKLKKYPFNCVVSGIGSSISNVCKSFVEFLLKSCTNSSFEMLVKALVMSSISDYLQKYPVSSTLPKEFDNITLADPSFSEPGNIDILIGADIFHEIILDGVIRPQNGPLAQHTELGWILSGPINSKNCLSIQNTSSFHTQVNAIDNSLRKFWELEEVSTSRISTPEETACDNYFQNTFSRSANGRYIVKLPFKSKVLNEDYPIFKNSLLNAQKRFTHLEQRVFPKNQTLKEEYSKFINEYISLSHMKFKCNLQDLPPTENGFILPHHGIWKESSSTTKLRVVFDGSSKPVNSTSLNEELLPGPSLQNDLSAVILKWRTFLFVFTSDIEKVFRQIIVHPEETKFQRILWCPDTFSSLQLYELQTVTYGTTCAPYLSIKVLQQLANDEADNYAKGAEVLKNDIYVDDIISGADDISSAKTIQKQLKELLSSGGFNLRKWTSNCPELLSDLQPEDCEFSFNFNDSNSSVKALGLFWNPKYDYFFFKISLPICNIFTKRTLLSDASKLFDPLGLLAPTTILAKIYFQQLWLEGIGWDDPLPVKLSSEWEQYRNNLSFLQTIKIPRWLGTISSSSIEIHGFSDASNHAYSAVLYCRTHRPNRQIFVNIITAKTKVAPIKQISLPRLELCGAVLLAKLFKKFISATQIKTTNLESYFWTDSTIVLGWIHALPIRWKTFVANRVSEIQEITNVNQWFHVSSEHNPADCASRGVQPQDLENHEPWWNGPRWLSCPKSNWPSQDTSRFFTDLDQKTKIFACTNVIMQFSTNLLSRFSSLNRLLRVTSHILRLRPKRLRIFSGYLKAIEIQTTLKHLITLSQSLSFPNEIKSLTTKKEISFKSKIVNLHPFVDKNNQLRVGGRLRFANIDDDSKYPLILSGSCNLSKLLVADVHLKTLHGGQKLIMSYIRTKYWITNLRNVARAEFHACVTCTRFNKMRNTQLMGSLPKVRVNQSRAFRHSGVDYAGPFDLKLSKGRSTKTYKGFICIFICLVTKAIHIELVSDMTSEGFLAAFRRFTARRGSCSHLYSDNGTNFVGAKKELIRMNRQFLQILSPDVRAQMENEGTSWSFIPPASPHFGGLWEAGVKSVKYHLQRILLNRIHSYEEMYTLLVQIEASLNSRPLSPLTDDPTDLSVLTPAHFLIGEPTNTVPEPSLLDLKTNRLNRWQHIQQMFQHFWDRWHKEYLSRLQQRPKWTKSKRNIERNDIVIIKDERYPPAKWPLARVVETHPGADGICRVVSVYANGKQFKRPITKLCLLPEVNTPNSSCSEISTT